MRALLIFLCLFSPLLGEVEKIPVVKTLSGDTYEGVKVMKVEEESVKFMHDGGIKTLPFSSFDEETALLLGLEEANKITQAAIDKRKKMDLLVNEALRIRAEDIAALRAKPKKEVFDWFILYLLLGSDLKETFGRAPDVQEGDKLGWYGVCWNPVTEKMQPITVTSRTYHDKHYFLRDGAAEYTTELVFICGGVEYEVHNRAVYDDVFKTRWATQAMANLGIEE